MGTSVRQAHHDRPLFAAEIELLRAVPAGACSPRLRRDTSAPVRNLPEAVVATGGMRAARRPGCLTPSRRGRPGMSVNSLRQTAAASTLTSHHCQTLLRSLTCGLRIAGEPGIALRAAADAAGQMRTRWLDIATPSIRSPPATRTNRPPSRLRPVTSRYGTGRLAYANPGWTLASGQAPAARPGEGHSREPSELTEVLAAVHDAYDAMSRIASADRRQAPWTWWGPLAPAS